MLVSDETSRVPCRRLRSGPSQQAVVGQVEAVPPQFARRKPAIQRGRTRPWLFKSDGDLDRRLVAALSLTTTGSVRPFAASGYTRVEWLVMVGRLPLESSAYPLDWSVVYRRLHRIRCARGPLPELPRDSYASGQVSTTSPITSLSASKTLSEESVCKRHFGLDDFLCTWMFRLLGTESKSV
ncbi:hypothetical protein SAMN05446635_2867 [Burkholderia sp. OK233]|nr:hypothetical protein SAMN05446635_2867 [Burkholderia sp. OK233]